MLDKELKALHQAVEELAQTVDLFLKDEVYICRHCKRENEGFGCEYCEETDG